MLVRDLMTLDPATVGPDSTVKHALEALAHLGVTALPVVDGDGRVIGVVSEADLIRDSVPPDPRAQASPARWARTPGQVVDEVYTRHPITVRALDDLAAAVDLMTQTGVKSLPVVDEHGRSVGIIARSDVVRMLARPDETIEAELDRTLRSLGHADWLVDVTDGHVEVSGPAGRAERSLADIVASTVPGVVDIRVV